MARGGRPRGGGGRKPKVGRRRGGTAGRIPARPARRPFRAGRFLSLALRNFAMRVKARA